MSELANVQGGGAAAGGATRRVTQFYDPSRGSFGPGADAALTANPQSGVGGFVERVVDGPWIGKAGPKTWVAPRAASEHTWWSRMLTGRGSYRSYVEFDVAAGELANPGGLKVVFSPYQQVIEGTVPFAGRNVTYGVLAPNYGQYIFLGTAGAGAAAGGGYLIYQATKDE